MIDHLTTLYEALRQLHAEGGHGNFVIFTAEHIESYYVQVAGSKGGDRLYAEAVSNDFLRPEFALTEDQIAHMRRLGWQLPQPGEEGNFFREWQAASDGDRLGVARFLLQTLTEVYGVPDDEPLDVNLVLE
jgi:hypothetical protein